MLNLGFKLVNWESKPLEWYVGGKNYTGEVDTQVVHSGDRSLRLQLAGDFDVHDFGVGTNDFPVEKARGKNIHFSGYIKTKDVESGYAGLWWRVDGQEYKQLAFDNMDGRGITGTTEWTRCDITLPVDTSAININFGVLLTGTGTAWFSDLSIDIDSVPYNDTPRNASLSAEQTEWLRKNIIPIATATPDTAIDTDPQKAFGDLMPLKQIIGDAHTVGLGEATHGTHEFFTMKHRLVEFLVREMGFTVFSIEASAPLTEKINDYVLHGVGDPKQLVPGMGFWTWSTEEVLDLVHWMRKYNESGKGPVQFTGFDMQFPQPSIDTVEHFIQRTEPGYFQTVKASYEGIDTLVQKVRASFRAQSLGVKGMTGFEEIKSKANDIARHIENNRAAYIQKSSEKETAWALHNAEMICQMTDMCIEEVSASNGTSVRDSAMAENVAWLHAQNPGAKIILWAHNGHISRESGSMGSYLTRKYGADYKTIGFCFHEGEYNASGRLGLKPYPAVPSYPGSFEWLFHSMNIPQFIIDLRKASPNDPASKWLTDTMDGREIGAAAIDGFYAMNIAKQFDCMIFFDKTTPSRFLMQQFLHKK